MEWFANHIPKIYLHALMGSSLSLQRAGLKASSFLTNQ